MVSKTVIIGASPNPSRYAFAAAERLIDADEEIVLLGIKSGNIGGIEIEDLRSKPKISNVNTVTFYLGPQNQGEYLDYILSLNPKRIIFNPGTENATLADRANKIGIETLEACTLVMLSLGNYHNV